MDAYQSPQTVALPGDADNEPKPSFSLTMPYTSDPRCGRLPVENGEVEMRLGCSANTAPPRKRLKRSSSASPQDIVEIKIADGVTTTAHPVCAATIFMPTAATRPSFSLAQTLPLSGRIIGRMWQPVQSHSTSTAVSTSSGIFLKLFC